MEDSLHFDLEREPDGEYGAFDEHEANIGFGTFDEAGKFDADGKAYMQEDGLTMNKMLRSALRCLQLELELKTPHPRCQWKKRLQRLLESSHDIYDDVEGSVEENNLGGFSTSEDNLITLVLNFCFCCQPV